MYSSLGHVIGRTVLYLALAYFANDIIVLLSSCPNVLSQLDINPVLPTSATTSTGGRKNLKGAFVANGGLLNPQSVQFQGAPL
jgi:hypothetical protein